MTYEKSSLAPEQDSTPQVAANFNDEVLVRITPAGEAMWNAAYADAQTRYPDLYRIERDAEGYTKLQLHEVARIFGPAMYNGNPRLPIEPNFKLLTEC